MSKPAKGWEKALILGIEDTHIESVVLGDYSNIKAGRSGDSNQFSRLKVPVGKTLFGRVMSPLGYPLMGRVK
jgi:F0F1-type ATP synthase alpha subunit